MSLDIAPDKSLAVLEKQGACCARRLYQSSRFAPPRRPLIALFGEFPRDVCIELAREWEWDLLDLDLTRQIVPRGIAPSGVLTDTVATHAVIEELLSAGCRAVRLGTLPHPLDHTMSAVLLDQQQIGQMAARHFLARGFKTVAHVGWDPEDPRSLLHPVYDSFRRCATEGGAAVHVLAMGKQDSSPGESDLSSFDYGSPQVRALLDALPKPVGVFAISDTYAARICVACRHSGTLVPEEVAVLGAGNTPTICEVTSPTLSSIDTAVRERARRAMCILRDLLAGGDGPAEPVVVPPLGVVERQSTDLLAVDDPTVAGALRFMWDHLQQNMSVDDVAEAVSVGRRRLERAFRVQLNRSVSAELQRKRLERCCHLLKTTDLPVADIAPMSGFSSSGYLNKVFQKVFGTTPRQWRLASVPDA